MQRMTMKAYAIKHKLSIFNVMKMTKSGKLKTDIVEENGKEITYILLDDAIEKDVEEGIVPMEERDETMLKMEVMTLKKEVQHLKEEIEELKKRL
ncbi:hypothetical protein [Sulfurovum sp.]|uniref:hypothetical protein n=1 Tax=Sulfurovum sp. TaxID=1969726 RepID=UPI0025D1DF32|nr:hypothetical protein [Sulfurovum sp.]